MKKLSSILMALAVTSTMMAAVPSSLVQITLTPKDVTSPKDVVILSEGSQFTESTTDGDATKQKMNHDEYATNVDVYMILPSAGNFAMVATAENKLNGKYIGVQASSEYTDYVFTFNVQLMGRKMYLEDIQENTKVLLTSTTTPYEFTMTANAKVEDRFRIVGEDLLCYTRTLNANQVFGTVCFPYAPEYVEGGKLYKMNYFDGTQLVLEEEDSYVAGKPYIFKADNAESVKLYYKDENKADDPVYFDDGIYGNYDPTTTQSDGLYVITGNVAKICAVGSTLGEYRAYINLEEAPEEDQFTNSSPTRRLAMPVRDLPAGLNQLTDSPAPRFNKVIIDGRFVIVRDGKEYNALGM